jgi:hypothetical protein
MATSLTSIPLLRNSPEACFPTRHKVLIAEANVRDLDGIARAVGRGTLRLPIVRSLPLVEGIEALTELETEDTPKGARVVITMEWPLGT